MALIEARNEFTVLRNSGRFSLIIPENGQEASRGVLWLLPPAGSLASDWVRYTGIETLTNELGLTVVMPEGLNSDYCDMVYGMKWWSYITEELPAYLEAVFGIRRTGIVCFGAGMGGLGALKLGLLKPEVYDVVGAYDVDYDQFERYEKEPNHRMETIYGTAPIAEEILKKSDPMVIVKDLQGRSVARILLEKNCEKACVLAEKLPEDNTAFFKTELKGWKGYAAALEEFVTSVFGS